MSESKPRVLSGIQPSGTLHLGNYFGAMRQHLELQHQHPGECYFFIADYHALTTQRDPQALRDACFDVAATYLAMGLDPEKALLFRQSDIPEVHELAWFLSCVTGKGLLDRATSYKDKVNRGIKPVAGLYNYPILMSADILLYQSTVVPVGKDQIQHIEFAQDMATYFNQAFAPKAPVLRRPEARLSSTPYVPGIDGQKMSKSYGNTIPLFESGKKLRKITGKVVTDSTALGEPLSFDRCNVVGLLKLFYGEEQMAQVEDYYRSGARDGEAFGYGHAKMLLAEAIEAHFEQAREKRAHYAAHPEEVEAVLQNCAQKARVEAMKTLEACRRACGIQ